MKNKTKKETIGTKYNKLGSVLWALRFLWDNDKRFVFFFFATVPVAVALPLVQSYFAKVLIDRIGLGAAFGELAAVCALFIGAILVLDVAKRLLDSRIIGRRYYFTGRLQERLNGVKQYSMDYEVAETQEFRKIFGYAWDNSSNGHCAVEWIWEDISKLLTDALGIVTYASLLAVIHPLLFAVVAVVPVVSYFPTRWQAAYVEKNKHQWEKERRKVDYLEDLSEDFPAAKDIKLYGLDSWLNRMLGNYHAHLEMWYDRCYIRGMWASILAGVLTLVQDGAAYIFLIALLLNGALGVGDFVFYFGVVGSIAAFLSGIVGDIATLHSSAEKIAYFRSVFDYPTTFNHGEGCPLPQGAVKIELRDVWYKYAGSGDYTIKGLDLTIELGESIALVGMNGAGKTTLVKLISGLYAPTKGEILVNGRSIKEYNIEEYYSLISAVFQSIKPVALTIFEFIATSDLSRPTAREDAVAALKAAGLWERVERLPKGLDTHLTKSIYDDGVELSGGEMQKLLLARAIYKNGSILLLDEPTAALDPIAENELYLKYRELTEGKTSLYISHRFASTRFCDRIILLEDGVISESGTHEELMAKNGQYAYMFGVQSQYYKEGEVHAEK